MSSSNITNLIPQIQFTPQGLVIPTTQEVYAGVWNMINGAFGGNLDPDLSTPQGQLATSLTAAIVNNYSEFAWLTAQIDPNNAQGFMQDAIGYFYLMTRKPGTYTVVQCVCTGAAGTQINVGAMATDTSNNVYTCTQAGVIPASGSITLPFQASVLGPQPCPAGTLTNISLAIPGWDSINNPSDGILGQSVESRQAFEYRRRQSVAMNGQSLVQAIYANVFNVSGVTDVYVYENNTSAAIPVGATNFSVAPNSVYVAVVGGLASAIAEAMWIKKSLGCNWNGNTSITVYDTNYQPPYPAYAVIYNSPTPTPIYFNVQIANNPALPANIGQLVQNAIINSFSGADGSLPARIGSTIYASKFIAPVLATNSNVAIQSLDIGTAAPAASNSVTMGIDQVPTVSAANITVTLV